MAGIICSFSGGGADLEKRRSESHESFRMRQFKAFAENPKTSAWDMSEGFYLAIEEWESAGLIEHARKSEWRFPWMYYRLTEKGKEKLATG